MALKEYEYYEYICECMAKAFTTEVRLYKDEECLYSYFVYELDIDLFQPYIHKIFESDYQAGIITNPLLQLYAFLTIEPGIRIIMGPTRALVSEGAEVNELLRQLDVGQEERDRYIKLLYALPAIHANRLLWLLVNIQTIIQGKPFGEEDVWVEPEVENTYISSQTDYMDNLLDVGEGIAVEQSVDWEELIFSYVEAGKTGRIRDILKSPPKVFTREYNGTKEKLQNLKYRGIYFINRLSRIAVKNGYSLQKAQIMQDMYVRKIETIQDYMSGEQLLWDMIVDFTGQIEQLRYSSGNYSEFCKECMQYISNHTFQAIQIEKMAKDLGYNRSYLCTKFKKEMKVPLTQYIQTEKIEEAKRLLKFMNYNLSEVANMLCFSSQSHFQTVFKKITGKTPFNYQNQENREY